MLSLKQELSTCSKWWTSPTSPNLDIGPWTSNCWMSSLTELVPCHRVESFCHAVTSRFWIHKHKVNLSFKLIHHHWHPGGVEDLLDLVHCPCPSGSTLHV